MTPALCSLLAALLLGTGAAPAPQAVGTSAGVVAPAPSTALTVTSPRGRRRVGIRTARGYPALRVRELSPVLSIESGVPQAGAISLRIAGQRFDLVLDAPYFRYADQLFVLAAAPYSVGDSLFIPLQFAAEFLPRLLASRFRFDPARSRLEELPGPPPGRPQAPEPRAAPARISRIVAIDAGHGGPDVGMVGPLGQRPFLREKDVTLAVAREMAAELGRRGLRAVLTRSKDTLIALRDRGRIAGADSADVFVSIHVNAANPRWRDASGARGYETYFLAEARTEDARRVAQMENESVRFETDADAPDGGALAFILNDLAQNEHLRESSRLADAVEAQLGRVHPGEGRGVKQAGFAVLATSYMPAVLVELGFGSNADEARYLTSAAGQRRLAHALVDAVQAYLAGYERRVSSPEGARR